MKMSDALRYFIKKGLDSYQEEKEIGQKYNKGIGSLMVNEKRAIRASIESLLIVRKLCKDPKILEEVSKETDKLMANKWIYDA